MLRDRPVVRVVAQLAQQRTRRLFTVDGSVIDAADVNERLEQVTGAHITAKDFRTWRGTLAAFTYLEEIPHTAGDAESHVVAAADAAAEMLGNTRAVARAHYIHPHVLEAFVDGTFADRLKAGSTRPRPELTDSEARLFGFLQVALDSDLNAAAVGLAT